MCPGANVYSCGGPIVLRRVDTSCKYQATDPGWIDEHADLIDLAE